VDRAGKLVIKPRFDSADTFSEGLALVEAGGNPGYIDILGNMVIRPKFNSGAYSDFSEGMALVKGSLMQIGSSATVSGLYGYIGRNGAIMIAPQFSYAGSFKNQRAVVSKDGKFGFINRSGNVEIKPQFDSADSYSERLARVELHGKFGFVDQKGNWMIQPIYDAAGDFKEGLAWVRKGHNWYFINCEKCIAPPGEQKTIWLGPQKVKPEPVTRPVEPTAEHIYPKKPGDIRYCLAAKTNAEIIACVAKEERDKISTRRSKAAGSAR
jgi:WG containing repeat